VLEAVDKEVFIKGIAENNIEHPTDSHPPLDTRLKSLGFEQNSFADVIKSTVPDPAVELIQNYTKLEEELSELEHVRLIKTGAAQLPQETNAAEQNEK
jgi:hypothetical protein